MIFRFSVSTAAGLFAAFVDFIHRRPRAALGLFLRQAALFVAFLDVLGLAFLLVGVLRFVASGHAGSC
jgi:hypothetical protein